MIPTLEELMKQVGSESNIGKFTNRFRKMTIKSAGNGVFGFIFNQPDLNFRMEESHYLDGQAIYEMFGYFCADLELTYI